MLIWQDADPLEDKTYMEEGLLEFIVCLLPSSLCFLLHLDVSRQVDSFLSANHSCDQGFPAMMMVLLNYEPK